MSLILVVFAMLVVMKMKRLIFILLGLEFLYIFLVIFFLLMMKLFDYYIFLMLGVFSSVICVSLFLNFIIIFGCDFVKF